MISFFFYILILMLNFSINLKKEICFFKKHNNINIFSNNILILYDNVFFIDNSYFRIHFKNLINSYIKKKSIIINEMENKIIEIFSKDWEINSKIFCTNIKHVTIFS